LSIDFDPLLGHFNRNSLGHMSFVTWPGSAEIDPQPGTPTLDDMKKILTILSLSTMLVLSAAAVADDPVVLRMYNDDADDVVLSVYDMNAQPPEAIISNQRISGFAWIPIALSAGAAGKGHLRWIARTVDPSFLRCGQREMRGVANDAMVYISANSSCRRSAR
jgi:hypothetical protein